MSHKKLPPSKRKAARDPDAMLARVTWMQVAVGRQMGHDDDRIRADVTGAIREALEGDAPVVRTLDGPGLGPDGRKVVSAAGMFRMALDSFDLDRRDQFRQEGWLAVVQRHLDRALAETTGDFRRRTT